MCGGISARVRRRSMPSAAASPQHPEPSSTTSASTVAPTAGCAVGAGCCVAWEVVLPRKRSAQAEAPAVATYPTPPRATIRRLVASEGSPWASLDYLSSFVEGPEDAESTHTGLPYLLQRITRSLSGLGRAPANAARGFQHAFGLDDGYDSEEDEEISEALFREVKGDLGAARKRNYATLLWRHKHGIDDVMDDPNPELERVLACWPRWLQGHAKDGSFVWYEKLGAIDAGRLRRERLGHHNVLARHVGLLCEYITMCLDPHGAWRNPYATTPRPAVTIVWDLEGMTAGKWANLAVRKSVRAWGDVLGAHYPGLVTSILVVNCPTYSPAALCLLEPLVLLPRTLRATVRIVGEGRGNGLGNNGGGGAPLASLADAIDSGMLPVAYAGGENPAPPELAMEWQGLIRIVRRSRQYHEYVQKKGAGEGDVEEEGKAAGQEKMAEQEQA